MVVDAANERIRNRRARPTYARPYISEAKTWHGRYFYRNELAGAFGDIGTFAPLVIGMTAVSGLGVVPVMATFGVFYVVSGLVYGVPIPIQPMKAIAALTIAGGIRPNTIMGSGIAVGIILLFATATGLMERLAQLTPKTVVRGIQLGLGLTLIQTSVSLMRTPVNLPDTNIPAWILAAVSIPIVIILSYNRRIPASLVVLGIGVIPPIIGHFRFSALAPQFSLPVPSMSPSLADVLEGLLVLAIPQIPLTIGNAMLATEALSRSLFPRNRRVTVNRLGLTMGVMNILSGFAGGIPICHGAGGLAGHYRFGARTGVSLLVIGAILLSGSLFYGERIAVLLGLTPLPILGVLLFFAGLELVVSIRGVDFSAANEVFILMFVGVICAFIPYGFLIGLFAGVLLANMFRRGMSERGGTLP